MLVKERPHHEAFVGLEPALHHGAERAFGGRLRAAERKRREGESRSAGAFARHQEPAGRQQAQRIARVAAGAKVIGEQLCGGERRLLVLAGFWVERGKMCVPSAREPAARLLVGELQRLGRPFAIAHGEQRQIEQPLAGIIDDVEGECAVGAAEGLIFDDEPQLAYAARRFRPGAVLDQRIDVPLVLEPRHRVVGLRLEPRPGDAPGGQRLE